jgi:hypothetical protein
VKNSGTWKLVGLLLAIAVASSVLGYFAMMRFILP